MKFSIQVLNCLLWGVLCMQSHKIVKFRRKSFLIVVFLFVLLFYWNIKFHIDECMRVGKLHRDLFRSQMIWHWKFELEKLSSIFFPVSNYTHKRNVNNELQLIGRHIVLLQDLQVTIIYFMYILRLNNLFLIST